MKNLPLKKLTIRFHTLGCKANQYDTQSIREKFLIRGFREIKNGLPDYFLINTCTVTEGSDQKSRNIIRRCIRQNPKAKVIVTGCLAEKDSASLAGIKGISYIIKKGFFPEGISSFSGHTRAFLKIQDGCSNFCSYCRVALVRCNPQSKDLAFIKDEAEKLVAAGYKEIVLTGICLGSYGKGIQPKTSLCEVIMMLEKINGLERIRLSSIELKDVTEELVSCFKKSKKLCRHLHIPVQSGDDAILKAMNRKYASRDYLKLIKALKKNLPGISITTDCLVGFPGETEKNFENSVKLIKKIEPLKVHAFSYSDRPQTKASVLSNKVKIQEAKRRMARLEDAAEECREEVFKSFLLKEANVLIEGASKKSPHSLEGFTDNYLPVKLPFKPGIKNKIVKVRLVRIENDRIAGEYVYNAQIKCRIKP